VLRGESPAVDARPALSTSDSILMCHLKYRIIPSPDI